MILLSKDDVEFLLLNLGLPDELHKFLQELSSQQVKAVPDDIADKLRDLCTDKLDTEGLDINYEPTPLGERLEELIDKLYIG